MAAATAVWIAQLPPTRERFRLGVKSGQLDLMVDMSAGFDSDEGREVLIDLARVAAGAMGSYANFVLTRVDDHVLPCPLRSRTSPARPRPVR